MTRATLANLAADLLGVAGAAALLEGVREVYAPAAWIVAGLMGITGAVCLAKARAVES
jgi:hypothetical protein